MADFFSRENIGNIFNTVKNQGIYAAKRAADFVKLTYDTGDEYGNGAALTPPMGWSSWNTFRNHINEELITETAEAMKNSGLADCGYKYVNLDDCWMSSARDENGRLCGDMQSFPGGIPALVKKINALGLKAGIYSSNGTLTCEDLPASLGHEAVDADTFAEWGIEYLKYDFGHNVPVPTTAPDIGKIVIRDCESGNETGYGVSDASLFGEAEIIKEEGIGYITGLSANRGFARYTVTADEEKEYLLTVIIRRNAGLAKYFEVFANSRFRYKIKVPAAKGYTPDGRAQFKIKLNKGENTLVFCNPVTSLFDSAAMQYADMGNELKRAAREYAEKNGTEIKPIVYSICEWGRNLPWKWGRGAGNLWRTTPDIRPNWLSIAAIYEINILLGKYAGVGGWNDPDMLEVGVANLSYEENLSHFALWCMMSAPLILGCDVRKFILPDGSVDTENSVYKLITDKDLIAIDQDPLGFQCKRIKTNGAEDVLLKPLENGDFAVCFFNKAGTPARMKISVREAVCEPFMKTPLCDKYEVYDLRSKETFVTDNIISASVAGHGVKIFRVSHETLEPYMP